MISDVKEKGSHIQDYTISSKRIPNIKEDRKGLVGIVSNLFVILFGSLLELYDEKCKYISYISKVGFRLHRTF